MYPDERLAEQYVCKMQDNRSGKRYFMQTNIARRRGRQLSNTTGADERPKYKAPVNLIYRGWVTIN